MLRAMDCRYAWPVRKWHPIYTAPEGVRVVTKIDDANGVRNETILVRQGQAWFTPNPAGVPVGYQPTHGSIS
ncbi:hypothetical protein HD841_000700 [Sphingomonas melonis]|jgi:hypothetical protein|uniref:Uncharacterized protein n=1 Tax=Sphingomonas melonis TaxID=152682 RepID=A0A7Y9FKD3_9SPHN|nr:hypothetical protein [Sphingomonas melonis]